MDAGLLFHGEYGVELQIAHEGVMAYARRWPLRQYALEEAEDERRRLLGEGWREPADDAAVVTEIRARQALPRTPARRYGQRIEACAPWIEERASWGVQWNGRSPPRVGANYWPLDTERGAREYAEWPVQLMRRQSSRPTIPVPRSSADIGSGMGGANS